MQRGKRTSLVARASTRSVVRPRRPATATEIAWLAALPCALATVAALLVLGPPLGALLPSSHVTPWPSAQQLFRPERTEDARFLIALAGPLLLSGAIALGVRRGIEVGASASRWIRGVQVLGILVLLASLVSQYAARFEARYTRLAATSPRTVYFKPATLVLACAIAAAVAAALHDDRALARLRALAREIPRRSAAAWAVALLAIGISVLPAVNLEHTIFHAAFVTRYHAMFTLDETYAVLDGRSPLVDFAAQYASLWPYPLALAMRIVGDSVGAFTILCALLTAAGMAAVFAVLRRVTASATAALALFLPLLATSFYEMSGGSANRYSLVTLSGIFPLRLVGPFLLLLLTARHLDGAAPRRRWLLFAAGGLVVLNNADFGVPAFGATAAALLWTGRPTLRAVGRLALEAAAGLALAYAAVAALTLARAGTLPDLGLLMRFARLFTNAGFGLLPIRPLIGVSTIVYLTYVAAIGAATVRAVGASAKPLHTGLLAWSGVFGLGVGAYYAGRSHPEVLTNMFPAWALALVLLVALVVERIVARPSRLPTLAEGACLVGFGVLACSLAQTPAPWTQLARLGRTTSQTYSAPGAVRFLAARTRRGEPVAILSLLGHRLAFRAGVVDVAPYTGEDSMPTREQLDETLRVLRAAGGTKVFAPLTEPWPEVHETLEAEGYRAVAYEPPSDLAEFVPSG